MSSTKLIPVHKHTFLSTFILEGNSYKWSKLSMCSVPGVI